MASKANPDIEPGAPSLRTCLWRDTRRVAAVSALGCLVLAVFELGAALITTPAPDVRLVTALRLVLIDITLIALLWALVVLPAVLAVALGTRLILYLGSRTRGLAWPGLWAGTGHDAATTGVRPAVAWLWAACTGMAVYVGLASYLTHHFITHYKAPQVTALLLSLIQVVLVVVVAGLAYGLGLVARRAAHRLQPRLGAFNPLGRPAPAVALLLLMAGAMAKLVVAKMPQLAPLIPWRHILAAAVLGLACHGAAYMLARPGALVSGRAARVARVAAVLLLVAIIPLTLIRVGADHEAKSVAMTGSPLMRTMGDLVRKATDMDDDGYGFLLGENDCAPFDRNIHPLARDIADNGIDEDCNGRDFSFSTPPKYKLGQRMPVPEAFQRPWNILLITVDTVRYDHTGFGGYIETRGRDTTPNLDDLVRRSISFTFANAPSAGTMASVPAILTSRFFHSGIALDVTGVTPGLPPRLKPENLLIAEILADHDYYTGAILSHEYFNDWGMDQGFDTYDNDIGKKRAPFKVTSDEITDKAIAWIAANSKREKWFLWAHYLDPHGRYVAHPDDKSFGTTEEDLYDGEIHYTDKHLGRLFKELSRMPGADRTIIIITSDHGDGFREHGFINHGQALYRELLHVPLIFYIPDVPPRTVDGAVSPLDIVPTVCDLIGVDPKGLGFEGESLVPQLFYQKDAHHRVVFAETNAPRPIRAAITSKHKLIFKLKENIYEFYDLVKDPWEKRNIYNQGRSEDLGRMKEYLDDWLERVYYSRDLIYNQAAESLKDILLDRVPSPKVRVEGVGFDQGRIEVLGVDTDQRTYKPGDKIRLVVYMRAAARPSGDFRLQVEAWVPGGERGDDDSAAGEPGAAQPDKPDKPGAGKKAQPGKARSKLRLTGGGLFPTSRWREGEYIRDRFQIRIPASWQSGDTLAIGLRMAGAGQRAEVDVSGPTRPGDKHLAVLATVGFVPGPEPVRPAPDRPKAPATP